MKSIDRNTYNNILFILIVYMRLFWKYSLWNPQVSEQFVPRGLVRSQADNWQTIKEGYLMSRGWVGINALCFELNTHYRGILYMYYHSFITKCDRRLVPDSGTVYWYF